MDPRRLQSAVAEYPYLRGLISVPAGALFIVAALGNWEWGPFAHAWVFLLALLVIAGACAAVNRYYNEHYGRVTPSTRQQVRAAVVALAGVAVVIGASTLLRSRADWSLDLPVNPIAVVFAVLMLAYSAAVAGLRPNHVVIWGSLFIAGALPVWTGDDPSNVGLVMCGVAIMVNGVFDHLALVRTFGPARLPTPDGAGG
jgi:4-hydroxybenzoate polyprenyltransferase